MKEKKMRYFICVVLLLGLVGCEPVGESTIEIDLQQTVDKVKVVITFTDNETYGSFVVNLNSREEIDAYQEQVKFLMEKLEEAQNQWEEKSPLLTLHTSSSQIVESKECYEFDESVWGPGPSDDMWKPEIPKESVWGPGPSDDMWETESPKVSWFQND
jgi:hypothetical protein